MVKRDIYLDNAKGVLITLVVIGHGLEFIGGWYDEGINYVLTLIYLLHMPAFCFFAGITTSKDRYIERSINMMCFFIVYQLIYSPFIVSSGWGWKQVFTTPIYSLWFIYTLSIWTMALPFVLKIKSGLLITIVISLVAGSFKFIGYPLGLGRTIYFFAFFLIGNMYGRDVVSYVKKIKSLYLKIYAISAILICTYLIYSMGLDHRVLYGVNDYYKFGGGVIDGAVIRCCIYAASSVLVISFMLLIGSNKGFITKIGMNSLSVYLLHGFILISFLGEFLGSFSESFGPYCSFVVVVLGGIALSIVLSTNLFAGNVPIPAMIASRVINKYLNKLRKNRGS